MTDKSNYTAVDGVSVLYSARTWTGISLLELKYPKNTPTMSPFFAELMPKSIEKQEMQPSQLSSIALSFAIAEEMAELDRAWHMHQEDGESRVEQRVGACLKKIAQRMEKAYATQSLDSSKAGVADRCAELEAKIAATDQRISAMRSFDPRPAQDTGASAFDALLRSLRLSQDTESLPSDADSMGANKVVQKSKEAKLKAAMAGGRSKKKKWSKGKVKEKLQNAVAFDKATYDRMLKEIPKAKLITPAVVSERLKVNGSMARQAIRHLEAKGMVESVGDKHHALLIYTRKIGAAADDDVPDPKAKAKGKPKKES